MREVGNVRICPHCHWDVQREEEDYILAVGTILGGHYLLGKKLGQGGFGITYVAKDLTLNRKIAIKEFYPKKLVERNRKISTQVHVRGENYASGNYVNELEYRKAYQAYEKRNMKYQKDKERFVQESRILAQVDNLSNVVSVYNAFVENNTAYIVMEFVEGNSLSEYVEKRRRTMTVNEMLRCIIPILEDLEQIHQRKVYHKDIAPDNIMITPDGKVKLIDFGSAQSDSNQFKRGYAPPEQCGAGGEIGAWTDVYAACVTMYWLLTGTVVTECRRRAWMDDYQTLRQKGVYAPARLDRILSKGLELNYQERTQSMKKLYRELHRLPTHPILKDWVTAVIVGGICAGILLWQWREYKQIDLEAYQSQMEKNWDVTTYLSNLDVTKETDTTVVSNENFFEYENMVYMRQPIEENLYYLIVGQAGSSEEGEFQAIMAGNFGRFCIDGENLYFRNEDDGYLYWGNYNELLQQPAENRYMSMLIELNLVKRLSGRALDTDFPFYLTNGSIYSIIRGNEANQYEIQKVSLGESVGEETNLGTEIALFQPYGDYLYFVEKKVNQSVLSRMGLNGQALERLAEFDGEITSMTIRQNMIYYLFNANDAKESCVGKIGLDGTGNRALAGQQEEMQFYSLSSVVDGDNIYYTCAKSGEELTNRLYCYNIIQGTTELISSDCGKYIATVDGEDYILYASSDQLYIMKMRKNGSNPIRMQEVESKVDIASLQIIQGHVYYRMQDGIGWAVISDEMRLEE